MAWLERRGDLYRLVFRYGGQRFFHALKTDDETDAQGCLARLKENLLLLERGRLEYPPGADLAVFLLSDGKLNGKPVIEKPLSLGEFFKRYREQLPAGTKEDYTLYIEKIHMEHLEEILGSRLSVSSIMTKDLQRYVDIRSKEKGRRAQPVSHDTIKKEIGTFASIWNKWAYPQGLVHGPAPTRGLLYRKRKEKRPFQTWEQIERQIQRGGLSEVEIEELWDSVFLNLSQLYEVLEFVKGGDCPPFLYVMFVFAAHTGARRSEMMRSRIDDFDFDANLVRIWEKKRDPSKGVHIPARAPGPFAAGDHEGLVCTASWRANYAVPGTERAHQQANGGPSLCLGFGEQQVGQATRLARFPPFLRVELCGQGDRRACHQRVGRTPDRRDEATVSPSLSGPAAE